LLNFWVFADLGSVICTFTIKKPDLEIPIIFVSWRGRNSFRPFVSHSSRKFYFSLCNIDPLTISKCIHVKTSFLWVFCFIDTIIEKLTIEEKANNNPKSEDT